ncbi:MAG TPA: hypothetical protein VEU55_03950 [Gemmatimonadales bacterium]|nr:hypothetical protein [Gemmatimonadales bacterium]
MRSRWLGAACGAALLMAAVPQVPAQAPAVLLMAHERVRPGVSAEYLSNLRGYARVYASLKAPVRFIGTYAIGGGTESVFFDPFASFADLDQVAAALSARVDIQTQSPPFERARARLVLEEGRVIARLDTGASYRPPDDLGRMRYVQLATFRVRPGHEGDWAELGQLFKAAATRAGIDTHWLAYDAVLGAPSGTHFLVQVYRSLAALDSAAVVAQAFGVALGPDGAKRVAELNAAAIAESRTDIYAIVPSISYPPEAWVQADPDFWKPTRSGR